MLDAIEKNKHHSSEEDHIRIKDRMAACRDSPMTRHAPRLCECTCANADGIGWNARS